MKRLLIAFGFMLSFLSVQAQGRKQFANFTQYKMYYNPSLTGVDGAVVRTLYRNQWTGFEDAPKTLLATAELDLSMFRANNHAYRFNGKSDRNGMGAKHALGLVLLHDQFGPSIETQLALNYGSAVRLSEQLSLRWGTALAYRLQRLDGNSLTLDQENDPRYLSVLEGNNSNGTLDLNLGISLVAARFYVGYAMQDVTAGRVISSGDDFLNDFYTRKHMLQAGYRTNLSYEWGVTVNGLYQYDNRLKSTLEGQLKVAYQNTLWAGAGYRKEEAYHVAAGLNLEKFTLSYAYETPIQDARSISKPTNEIALGYKLMQSQNRKQLKQPLFW
ncbi:PorP/SprF family type IX secretion system membrane protein [Pontibacter sp. CAU 1760]